MKERPILFSAPMVRAILAGRKTQTRRVLGAGDGLLVANAAELCRYGVPGDRLWVRETWAADESLDLQKPSDLAASIDIEYLADGHRAKPQRSFDRGKTRVSIFMPRWASRILLGINLVRVQRLQDISEADAQAEGVEEMPGGFWTFNGGLYQARTARDAFAALWEHINGSESWHANPWVWPISFDMVQP